MSLELNIAIPPGVATSVPNISIGMPVFNGETYIEQAILSLQHQSEKNWELIISDNASSDRTAEICQQYAAGDTRIRYIRQPENIGVARNFEFVFLQSVAPAFMWAAADDVWDQRWLELLLSAMGQQKKNLVFGRLEHVDATGQPVPHTANGRTFGFSADSPLFRRLCFFLEPEAKGKANAVYGLYPRQALMENLSCFMAGYGYGDCVMIWRMLQGYKLASVPETFISKRLHHGAISGGMPTAVHKLTWRMRYRGIVFTLLTQTSLRGVTDYLRSECSLTTAICFFLIPLKVAISLVSMRATVNA